MLQAMGLPLSDIQRRPLLAAYMAEQERRQDEQRNSLRVFSQEQNLRQQAERNSRLLEAISSHLSARQEEALRTSLENQLARNRAAAIVQRRREEIRRQRTGVDEFVVAESATVVTN
jgi:hypothetical protein